MSSDPFTDGEATLINSMAAGIVNSISVDWKKYVDSFPNMGNEAARQAQQYLHIPAASHLYILDMLEKWKQHFVGFESKIANVRNLAAGGNVKLVLDDAPLKEHIATIQKLIDKLELEVTAIVKDDDTNYPDHLTKQGYDLKIIDDTRKLTGRLRDIRARYRRWP